MNPGALHLDEAQKLKRKALATLGDLLESEDESKQLKAAVAVIRIDTPMPDGPISTENAIVRQGLLFTLKGAKQEAETQRLLQAAHRTERQDAAESMTR